MISNEKHAWIYDVLLILVLGVGTYFRVVGLNWDQNQHLHPDERFMTMVESALEPVSTSPDQLGPPPTAANQPWRLAYAASIPDCQKWGGYFNTYCSSLNPENRGYPFFVYGDFPTIAVRYVAQWFGQVGYDQVNLIGRQISAFADLLTVLLIYLIAARLYNRRVALLGAAFSAFAVMQIQQSHFFTVDTFANLFIFLAIYFAVEIVARKPSASESPLPPPASRFPNNESRISNPEYRIAFYVFRFAKDPLFLLSLGFGLSLGMATASKLNAAPLAILLPGAFLLRYLIVDRAASSSSDSQSPIVNRQSSIPNPPPSLDYWARIALYLIAGAAISVLAFRIFMPYAFKGLGLSPTWLDTMKQLQAQSSGDADVPFALQWARRSHLFSFDNLTVWGLGLPLGILAWAGFLVMLWRIVNGELKHLLLWGWTAVYFTWQSMAFNPTMRYQLPIYPLLCMMAAWLVIYLWDRAQALNRKSWKLFFRLSSGLIGGLVLVLTLGWAYAFTRIYTRPVSRVAATAWIYQNVPGPVNLHITTSDGTVYNQPLPFPSNGSLLADSPSIFPFTANATGTLSEVYFPHILAFTPPIGQVPTTVSPQAIPAAQVFRLEFALKPDALPGEYLASASVGSDFAPQPSDPRGKSYTLALDHPFPVVNGQTYFLRLETNGALTMVGAAPINETDWDDGLPLRYENYDGFGGLYQGGLNLQIYFDDNADKLARFVNALSQGDYIFMSSNRQWASVTRIPERYPLTTAYYRALIGCPPDKDVIWCYNVAKPGMFQGQLGYKLVQVFESFPTISIPGLGTWQINDQFAEEAFTVYDHPKVLIFQKASDFNPAKVQALLGSVDLTNVIHLTPKQATDYKSLMLPADKLAQQQAGGTWSQLFNYDWIQNSQPLLGLVFWYLFIFLLGLLMYPILRLALPGLGDKGYPLSRALGLILLGFGCWAAGSLGVPVTRLTVGVIFALLALVGLILGWRQRHELREEWQTRKKYFLMIEGLFLAFFLFDLLIRIGNPDLWHPYKGGERPMDFSYFNAVIKSTSFPPYDPWFAGGTINYYYYGFVLVGMPVKLLGIVPTLAYNFILPTLFSLVAMGAFCIGWNLVHGNLKPASPPQTPSPDSKLPPPDSRISNSDSQISNIESQTPTPESQSSIVNRQSSILTPFDFRFLAGLLAALLMVVLGNLGTIRMVYQGLERLAAPSGNIDIQTNIFQRMVWAGEGVGKIVTGSSLPYGRGDWYWDPSRVIPPGPGNEITEFPFFTFLYSDLHAHMMVIPVALFVVAWALSVVMARARWRNAFAAALSFLIGGLAIGALYPTNLSDIYTYLPLALAALAYAIWKYTDGINAHWLGDLPAAVKKIALILGAFVLLVALSYGLYEPYRAAYSQGYNWVDPWTASQTPIWSYFAHWGVFLFFIIVWLAWETRQWMASTPVSSLNNLRPYQILVEAGIAVFLAVLLYLAVRSVQIGWVALPIAAWAGILLLRPGQPDVKRVVLFLIGTAMLITIMVELVAVRGDIGRMNTIFKFYLQAWLLLAVSSGAAFVWIIQEIHQWRPAWRNFFQAGASVFLAGAFAFTLTATFDKVSDRMSAGVPLTLDSITYMQYSQYADFGVTMDLVQDYKAIRWMQDNVQGSPVIVEANCPEYRWCTRFTIYTGLPGVVGWNWHQRQQRTLMPQLVEARVNEINAFYTTTDLQAALAFLKKYDVKYIILGQLERAEYKGAGLDKFEAQNGKLWNSVYRDGNTVIYQVNP
jgi:YYY domain-containing protein